MAVVGSWVLAHTTTNLFSPDSRAKKTTHRCWMSGPCCHFYPLPPFQWMLQPCHPKPNLPLSILLLSPFLPLPPCPTVVSEWVLSVFGWAHRERMCHSSTPSFILRLDRGLDDAPWCFWTKQAGCSSMQQKSCSMFPVHSDYFCDEVVGGLKTLHSASLQCEHTVQCNSNVV